MLEVADYQKYRSAICDLRNDFIENLVVEWHKSFEEIPTFILVKKGAIEKDRNIIADLYKLFRGIVYDFIIRFPEYEFTFSIYSKSDTNMLLWAFLTKSDITNADNIDKNYLDNPELLPLRDVDVFGSNK